MTTPEQASYGINALNDMKTNLINMYETEKQKVKSQLETQLSGQINSQLSNVNTTYQPQIANAMTTANQAKFGREDILQNIQRQRQQQSLQTGNNYLEGLR